MSYSLFGDMDLIYRVTIILKCFKVSYEQSVEVYTKTS